jgi:hypothetical protein
VVGGKSMPEVSKTEIGRRFFKLQKEKGVEKAIGKIRRSLGPDWALFTLGDIEALKYILGQSWVYIERDMWEKITFTQFTSLELRELIKAGNDALDKRISEETAVQISKKILLPSTMSNI